MLIAQFNLARLRHGPDDPRLVGFSAGANMIRRAAAEAPGHVWNTQDVIDDTYFATRSLWESVDALRAFVYSGIHLRYLKRTSEWFEAHDDVNLVLWCVANDEVPDLQDSRARLLLLREHGSTARAFSFRDAAGFLAAGA